MRIKAIVFLLFGLLVAAPAAAQLSAAAAPPPAADPENILLLDLSSGGRVTIQLRPDVAPNHVARMKELARKHFYDGLVFHRVIEGFMAQGGDPKGDGTGGSDLPDLKAEFNGLPHVRGALAAARAQSPDSANSQFYIMLAPRLTLDGQYTVFGRVVGGMNFVDAIERGEPPMEPTKILQASVAADNVPPPATTTAAPLPAPSALTPQPPVAKPSAPRAGETSPPR